MRGIDSEVSGIFSAMASINTENAKRTVTPAKKFLKIGKLTESRTTVCDLTRKKHLN